MTTEESEEKNQFPPYECDSETGNPCFVGLSHHTHCDFFRVQSYLANLKQISCLKRELYWASVSDHKPCSLKTAFHTDSNTYGEVDTEIIEQHKARAQIIFKLFKKKECERKRRARKSGRDCTCEIFLNRCGVCDRLRPAVNLFWGELLCDKCYFSPSRIRFIMERRFGDLPSLESKLEEEVEVEMGGGEVPREVSEVPRTPVEVEVANFLTNEMPLMVDPSEIMDPFPSFAEEEKKEEEGELLTPTFLEELDPVLDYDSDFIFDQ